jgi:hypothetical protein
MREFEDQQTLIMQEVAHQLQQNPNMSPTALMRHIQTKFDIVQEGASSSLQGSPDMGSPIKEE